MSPAELYARSWELGTMLVLGVCLALVLGDLVGAWWSRRQRRPWRDPECWCPWREEDAGG